MKQLALTHSGTNGFKLQIDIHFIDLAMNTIFQFMVVFTA